MGTPERTSEMLPAAEQDSGKSNVDLFFERLRQLHAEPFLVKTEEETVTSLKKISGPVKSAVLAGLPPRVAKVVRSALEGVDCTSVEGLAPSEAIIPLSQADLGVTWAQYGVVNQGALVEIVHDDAQKLAS